MKTLRAVFFAVFCLSAAHALPPIALPIYIEDNHAGAFYWLAQNLDLNEACTLLHFDAHSDASAIFNSDNLRDDLRRVVSREERAERLEAWRRKGTVQCFSWIEPLMPSPIGRVIWVPPVEKIAEKENPKTGDARVYLPFAGMGFGVAGIIAAVYFRRLANR